MFTNKNKSIMPDTIYNIIFLVICLFFITPILWSVSNSLRGIYDETATIIPESLHFENYKYAVTLIPFFRFLKNSIILVSIMIALSPLSSALGGFAFARLNSPLKNILFVIVLATMMIPPFITLIPTYIFFIRLNLIGTWWIFVLRGLQGLPFFIFLFRQYFSTIPKELEDSAKIDGCSLFRTFWNIFIPNSKPIFITVLVLQFQFSWGDFMGPYLFLGSKLATLPVALMNQSYTLPGEMLKLEPVISAATVFLIIPTIIVFFFSQKRIMSGFTTSGLKG